MARRINPIILNNTNFTASQSPLILDIKQFLGQQQAANAFLSNDGLGDFKIQAAIINSNFGDELIMHAGDVFEVMGGHVSKIKITHVSDSSFRLVISQAEVRLVTGQRTTTKIQFGTQVKKDSNNPRIQYIGKSIIGSLTSEPKWQIRKVDCTSGTSIIWADGNDNFDNIYDNRESLIYS